MKIQREAVIATALNLLDEVGVEGLTMRRLAQALEIKAASLYWHFTNKQALMDGMADALMERVASHDAARSSASTPWQATVGATAHEVRQVLLSRRDGARVFAGTYVATNNTLRVAEALIGPLREAGASTRLAAWGAFSILYYVMGFVMEEQPLVTPNVEALDIANQRGPFAALAATGYPYVLASMDDLFNPDFDARFDLGLDLLVAGLQLKIAEACAPAPEKKGQGKRRRR